jgi:hypothetical protein
MKTFRDYLAEAEPALTKKFSDNDIAPGKSFDTFKVPQGITQAPAAPKTAPAPTAPKAAPHQHVPGATWNKGVLGIGSTGPEVDKLRQRLGLAPNGGKFDNQTRDAVIQRQKELGIQADGAWGPGTASADAAKPKTPPTPPQGITQAPAKPAAPTQGTQVQTDDDGNHMITTPDGKTMLVGPDGKPVPNGGRAPVAPTTQPPATAANPSAGTVGGATKAIPTAPVNPANPGGVSSKMNITPDQAQAALDNGSERDITAFGGRERLQQLAGVKPALKSFDTFKVPQGITQAPAAPTAPTQPADQYAVPGTGGISSLDPSQFQKGPYKPDGKPPEFQKGPYKSDGKPPEFRKLGMPAADNTTTAGGAVTARPIRPATGAQAQAMQRRQAQDQMPESTDAVLLNKMLTIAGLR